MFYAMVRSAQGRAMDSSGPVWFGFGVVQVGQGMPGPDRVRHGMVWFTTKWRKHDSGSDSPKRSW